MQGLVIKNTGSWYIVRTDDGQLFDCKVKGNFRLKEIRSTNPVAVGDYVTIIPGADGVTALIDDIQDRRNYIIRKASNLSKQSHIIAANVDLAALIVTVTSHFGSGSARNETVSAKNSIYVEEIGRTCYLDGEDWYDSQTEWWFYYNDSVSPYQWQYWYEGISSDYGDYGWMEYDYSKNAWFIETGKGKWESDDFAFLKKQ